MRPKIAAICVCLLVLSYGFAIERGLSNSKDDLRGMLDRDYDNDPVSLLITEDSDQLEEVEPNPEYPEEVKSERPEITVFPIMGRPRWEKSDEIEEEEPIFEYPYDLSTVIGYLNLENYFNLNETQKAFLQDLGFVGISDPRGYDDFSEAYNDLYNHYLPIFVTTDSMLHAYHIFFDDLLLNIEEDYLIGYSENMTWAMWEKSIQQYENVTPDLEDMAIDTVAYFSIAMKLLELDVDIPSYVEEIVNQELSLIETHVEMCLSPLFDKSDIDPTLWYMEDYTQYKPRGHYTRSERLQKYFRAMMWYGRMTFRLKSDHETIQAMMITDAMQSAYHNGLAADFWYTIYEITSYFVGESDDLTHREYQSVLDNVYGSLSSDYNELLESEKFDIFCNEMEQLRKPTILSSIMSDQEDLTHDTMGLRFMGQRYIPDSYMFQQLVYTNVGEYYGFDSAFTTITAGNPPKKVRGFPRGLDIMSVLGAEDSERIINDEGDADYDGYFDQLNKLKDEFSEISEEEWTQNMYWSWLYSLKSLTKDFSEEDYPHFMKSTAWQDEKLNTNLGSWAELRHDTILYAKQSYTPIVTTAINPTPPPPVHYELGYVEPVPEFWQRIIDLTNITIEGLNSFGVLSPDYNNDLVQLRDLILQLKLISEKELRDEELTPEEYYLIRHIGESLESIFSDVDEEGLKTTMVADVHTEPNTGHCLEEGVGYIDFVMILVKMPDGSFASMAGPIFSYYEFKHPMQNRLTDEEWEEILEQGSQPPRPIWVESFLP